MANHFTLDGTYNISADRFWKELYFSAEYTRDLLCHGLKHLDVKLIRNEEKEDGSWLRCFEVVPDLTMPRAIQKLIGSRFHFVEEGVFDPAERRYRSDSFIKERPNIVSIKTGLQVHPISPTQCQRRVSIDINCSLFGIGSLVETTTRKMLTDQYERGLAYTNTWLEQNQK